jgi:hypothetical protein
MQVYTGEQVEILAFSNQVSLITVEKNHRIKKTIFLAGFEHGTYVPETLGSSTYYTYVCM